MRCNPFSNGGYDPVERQTLFRSNRRRVGRNKRVKTAALVVLLISLVCVTLFMASCSLVATTTTTTSAATTTTVAGATTAATQHGAPVTTQKATTQKSGGWYQTLFTPIANLFYRVLNFFHSNLGIPWGWAIVLLTVVIRLILVPLTWKQIKSMRAMQALQPQLKALQVKYKNDRQTLNQKTMEFYSENKVNPFGSCLPLILQIPVFIGLFFMLKNAGLTVAKGGVGSAVGAFVGPPTVGWLWIQDITKFSYVLLVLYIATQFYASWQMAKTSAGQQKMIAIAMPVVVGLFMFLYRWPAGLFIYWVTSNLWTIGQQYAAEKLVPVPTPGGGGKGPNAASSSKKGGGRFAALMARAAEEQNKAKSEQQANQAGKSASTPGAPKKAGAKGGAGKPGGAASSGKPGGAGRGTSKSGSAGAPSSRQNAGRPGGQTGGKAGGQKSGQQKKTADGQGKRPQRGTGGPKGSS
jgi:YidC/Oxa1 family membrane protein insertase